MAVFVVLQHVAPRTYDGCGFYAVFAFYVLSGYVVSFILYHHYLPLRHGLRKFAINRALRVYPLYWLMLAAALYLVTHFPAQAREFSDIYAYPGSTASWLANLFTFGMVHPLSGLFGPTLPLLVGWSLGMEMLYWALLPLPLLYPPLRRPAIVAAAAYALVWMVASGFTPLWQSLPYRFFNVFAAALPFALGYWLFAWKFRRCVTVSSRVAVIAGPALIALQLLFVRMSAEPLYSGLYLALLLNTLIIACLSGIDQRKLPDWLQKVDALLGNLAYPLYLVHVPTAMALHVAYPGLRVYSMPLFAVTLAAGTVIAWLLFTAIERPINHFRHKIAC